MTDEINALGAPVHMRLLMAELSRITAEIGRLDQLREAHVGQDTERARLIEVRLDERARMLQTAQDKFEATVIARFAMVNEFRGSLEDLSKRMATRDWTEAELRTASASVGELTRQISQLRSRIDQGPPALHSLEARQHERAGATELSATFWTRALAVLSIVVALGVGVFAATHHDTQYVQVPTNITTVP